MHLNKESIEEIDKEVEQEDLRKVEAALFIAGKFMSIQELVALTDVNLVLLKRILEDLSEKYKESGVEVINKSNLWKMDVSSNYVWMVNRLAGGSSEFTRAEQETLALIAYKQPMKQSVVVKIRGNKAYDHIRNFVARGLINKKRMGHTAELTLNESFFDYFSLTGNADLNNFEIISKSGGKKSEANKEEKISGGEKGMVGDNKI